MSSQSKTLHQSTIGRSLQGFSRRLLLSEYFVLYLSIAYFLVLVPFIPRLASPATLGNIFSNLWPLFAVAIGETVVFIVAGIDLSLPSIMGLTSVVGAVVMSSEMNPLYLSKSPLWGWLISETGGPLGGSALAVPVGILVMLCVGALIGCLNGLAIAKLNMPAFMVTLVSLSFFLAFSIKLTQSNNVVNLPDGFIAIGSEGLGPIPFSLIATGILALIAHVLLSRTVLGEWFYATGASKKVAIVSGVPTKRVTILAYTFSGICAAVAAIIYSGRLQMGRPTLGSNMLMDIVGATIIGGTSMFGGKGKVAWTLFGVLFFVLLSNTLYLLNLSYFTINIVKGGVILLAALLDVTRTRIVAKES